MKRKSKSVVRALKETNEILMDHEERIDNLEKIATSQAREITQLQQDVRDAEIREKAAKGVKGKDLASEYGLTPGRISQIRNQ
jgi:hypothetical protein